MTETAVTSYFAYWRRFALGDREIVEGLVQPEHAAPSPALDRALQEWNGHYYWESASGGRWLVLVREVAPPRERWWLHAALFLVTLITTTVAGAAITSRGIGGFIPTSGEFLAGLTFSLPLAAVLLAHESGHYVAARRYRINASPPFFIPFPGQYSLLGTLGAFIRLRSPLFDRRTLFDVGVSGPLAGLVVAIPVLVVGLVLSAAGNGDALPLAHQYVVVDGARYYLGDSLILWTVRVLIGHTGVLMLHPLALAGWVGILVTCLNLLPLAQFDGGHIAYATFGWRQQSIAQLFWLCLIPLGFLWGGWWVWAGIALVISRGRLGHPPLMAPERRLDPARRRLGLVTIVLFILTFIPRPVSTLDTDTSAAASSARSGAGAPSAIVATR